MTEIVWEPVAEIVWVRVRKIVRWTVRWRMRRTVKRNVRTPVRGRKVRNMRQTVNGWSWETCRGGRAWRRDGERQEKSGGLSLDLDLTLPEVVDPLICSVIYPSWNHTKYKNRYNDCNFTRMKDPKLNNQQLTYTNQYEKLITKCVVKLT